MYVSFYISSEGSYKATHKYQRIPLHRFLFREIQLIKFEIKLKVQARAPGDTVHMYDLSVTLLCHTVSDSDFFYVFINFSNLHYIKYHVYIVLCNATTVYNSSIAQYNYIIYTCQCHGTLFIAVYSILYYSIGYCYIQKVVYTTYCM